MYILMDLRRKDMFFSLDAGWVLENLIICPDKNTQESRNWQALY